MMNRIKIILLFLAFSFLMHNSAVFGENKQSNKQKQTTEKTDKKLEASAEDSKTMSKMPATPTGGANITTLS